MSRRSAHRGKRARLPQLRTAVVAAAVAVVAVVVIPGTYAYWTDSASVSGTSLSSGTIDVQVGGADSSASTTLSMGAMVPGSSSAELVTLRNNGTAPFKWTISGGLNGTDAAAYAASGALRVTVADGASRTGTGSAASCSGGTTLVNGAPLTATPGAALSASAQGPLAAGATRTLCISVALDPSAPSTLQGKTASAVLSFAASSDLS